MLRIRLTRVGKKRQPYYRVVVADAEAKRDGRIVENIGHYTALTDPITFAIKEERALYWLSVGAQPSDAVRRLLEKQGTMERLARLKAGEPLETLVAEIQVSAPAEPCCHQEGQGGPGGDRRRIAGDRSGRGLRRSGRGWRRHPGRDQNSRRRYCRDGRRHGFTGC
jgi:small subunit ribosomal protein S16